MYGVPWDYFFPWFERENGVSEIGLDEWYAEMDFIC